MGIIIEGTWHDQEPESFTSIKEGAFVRAKTSFRHWITPDGSPGPTGEGGFEAEKGRYHLYVSFTCPWAQRTLIYRVLARLESFISVSVVEPHMMENGWEFHRQEGFSGLHQPGATEDHLYHKDFLHQIYVKAMPTYTGRCSVPVLWDKKRNTLVNNESADIIRMFSTAFSHLTGYHDTLHEGHEEADALNTLIYENVNNAVYRAGFATTQEAYEEAVVSLFKTLDRLEQRLEKHPYLLGESPTESDWRLFPTLIRFDPVYVGLFKTNLKRIVDYPALQAWLERLYAHPGIKETVNFTHIKQGYYYSHPRLSRIVPLGPVLRFESSS